MIDALDIAQRWEDASYQFILHARAMSPPDQAFSPRHIMLAALSAISEERWANNPLHTLIDVTRRDQCAVALRTALALQGEAPTTPDKFSTDLVPAFKTWEQVALNRNVRVTTAFILWHLLVNDPVVNLVFVTAATDTEFIARSLEHHFDPLFTTTITKIPLENVTAPLYKELADFTEWLRPSNVVESNATRQMLYDGMHPIIMANILNVLGTLEQSKIAIVRGAHGTPVRDIDKVLADVLAAKAYDVQDRPRLQRRYQLVYRINLGGLRNWGLNPANPPPHLILQLAMDIAVKNQAILVVNELETLKHRTEIDFALLSVLADPKECLVLGSFETNPPYEEDPIQMLDLTNAELIAAHAYSPAKTLNLLQKYYLPQWQLRYGYDFAPDAFETVIALEPGAWINLRRKTLPYLVVGLALDTIQTARGGTLLMLDTIQMALDALDKLNDEWGTSERRHREQFKPVLDAARADIQALQGHPQPERNQQGNFVLTRGHVAAQLICPNDSEFHYPNHAPEGLMQRGLQDMPR
jgi:hypothetical protein